MMHRIWKFGWILGIAFSVSLVGCETTPLQNGDLPTPMDQAFERDEDVLAAVHGKDSEPPPEVSEALLPAIGIHRSGKGPIRQQRFDITVNEAPAHEFFMALVEGTDENIVLHPGIDGTITLTLKNVTIKDVLNAVHDVYGYNFEDKPYGYRVLPNGLQTRIYEVNYLNIQRNGVSQISVAAGQIASSGGSSDSGDSSSGSAITSGTQIGTTTESEVWEELSVTLEVIVGTEEGRSVVVNADANMVIVRAMPDELHDVENFLKIIEGNLERQVILEARVLEVTLNDGYQQGVNWGALRKQSRKDTIFVSQLGGGSSIDNSDGRTGNENGAGNVLSPTASFIESDFTSFGGVFTIGAELTDFAAFIELLETQGNVETLSSPRISSMNNQKALIKVGVDEFFAVGLETTNTTTGTATTTEPTVEIEPFFSGIALDVVPQISADGYITLYVHPTVSVVEDQTKTFLGSALPLARSTIRESDSIVRSESGQIIVIGGLMENKTNNERASVPWLSRIPLWGTLFRQMRNTTTKTELVILLKATIVEDGTWDRALARSRAQFERLRKGYFKPSKNQPEVMDPAE